MLMLLMKQSRPDIINMTMKPCRIQRVMMCDKICNGHKNLGLKLEPTGNANEFCEMVCFSNNNYAENIVSSRSVSGFVLCILGVLVSW